MLERIKTVVADFVSSITSGVNLLPNLSQLAWAGIAGMLVILLAYGCGRLHGRSATLDRLERRGQILYQTPVSQEAPAVEEGF